MPSAEDKLPHVVIVGGGFGGLGAARALRRLPVRITLVDKSNHHLFQPLLYQVATAMLTPGQIAAPIRQVLKGHRRANVLMGEVQAVDAGARRVTVKLPDGRQCAADYDFLVVATGVQHSYFGHDEFEPNAPGLKTMADATKVRNRILLAFEEAESEPDPATREALLTFVLVGGGPTGVEMAGAIAELARQTMRENFRRIDPAKTRIVLVEAGPRLLSAFHPSLSAKVARRLTAMGVEVRTGHPADHIDATGVTLNGERLAARTVIWTAGVTPSPVARWLGAPADRAGRVRVRYDLSVAGAPEVFVIGDVASYEQDGRPLPGVAQVAMQMGAHVARTIAARLSNDAPPPPFHYVDKGSMAVVGRNYAVFERGRMHFDGYLAFVIWSMIHVLFLALPNLRLSVFVQWVWSYFSGQRGSRLIVQTPPAGYPEWMEIRPLSEPDADALWALRRAALETEPQAFGESLEEHLKLSVETMAGRLGSAGGASFVIGAFAGPALVGMVGFYRDPRPKRRHRGWIWGMYLAPAWRGHGAGRQLLETAIRRAAAIPGLERVLLSVNATQTSARRLYESCGFRAWGAEPQALLVDGRFHDEDHMTLKLDPARADLP